MKGPTVLTDLSVRVGQLVAKYAPATLQDIDEGALARALFSAMAKAVKDGWWKHQKVLIKRPGLMDNIYKNAEKELRDKFNVATFPPHASVLGHGSAHAAKKDMGGDGAKEALEPLPELDEAPALKFGGQGQHVRSIEGEASDGP